MKRDKTHIAFGAALLGAFAAFWRWHSPRVEPLTKEEIDYYLGIISMISMPGDENAKFIAKLRPWAEADDGKPVYILNMIRFDDELHRFPRAGVRRDAGGVQRLLREEPRLALAPERVIPGARRSSAGADPDRHPHPEDAAWSQAKFVRYPSRRKFLELLSHPSYGPYEPYKFMSMEIDLVPVKATVIPDLRWIVGGGLLALYLSVGWRRAARDRLRSG